MQNSPRNQRRNIYYGLLIFIFAYLIQSILRTESSLNNEKRHNDPANNNSNTHDNEPFGIKPLQGDELDFMKCINSHIFETYSKWRDESSLRAEDLEKTGGATIYIDPNKGPMGQTNNQMIIIDEKGITFKNGFGTGPCEYKKPWQLHRLGVIAGQVIPQAVIPNALSYAGNSYHGIYYGPGCWIYNAEKNIYGRPQIVPQQKLVLAFKLNLADLKAFMDNQGQEELATHTQYINGCRKCSGYISGPYMHRTLIVEPSEIVNLKAKAGPTDNDSRLTTFPAHPDKREPEKLTSEQTEMLGCLYWIVTKIVNRKENFTQEGEIAIVPHFGPLPQTISHKQSKIILSGKGRVVHANPRNGCTSFSEEEKQKVNKIAGQIVPSSITQGSSPPYRRVAYGNSRRPQHLHAPGSYQPGKPQAIELDNYLHLVNFININAMMQFITNNDPTALYVRIFQILSNPENGIGGNTDDHYNLVGGFIGRQILFPHRPDRDIIKSIEQNGPDDREIFLKYGPKKIKTIKTIETIKIKTTKTSSRKRTRHSSM